MAREVATCRELVLPLCAEKISIAKRQVVTGRAQVSTSTQQHEEMVSALLTREEVEIERVPIGQRLSDRPEVSERGDILVIPVVEEVIEIERQYLLKEEIRIRRVQSSHTYQERVNLRRQEVVVTHQPVTTQQAADSSAAKTHLQNPGRRTNGLRKNCRCIR